jgi:hypothetical protein
MAINYKIAGIVLLLLILLVVFLIRRNLKDEKKFEKDMSKSELDPEQHEKDDQTNI